MSKLKTVKLKNAEYINTGLGLIEKSKFEKLQKEHKEKSKKDNK